MSEIEVVFGTGNTEDVMRGYIREHDALEKIEPLEDVNCRLGSKL